MNITLKPEQEQFIQSQIERGIFANPEQAIEAALRLLEEQSRGYEEWVEETRAKIDVGLAQLERGEKFPIEVAFERLERKFTKVQDAESYQQLLDKMELLESIVGIRKSIEEFEQGKGIPLKQAFAELREKYGLPD